MKELVVLSGGGLSCQCWSRRQHRNAELVFVRQTNPQIEPHTARHKPRRIKYIHSDATSSFASNAIRATLSTRFRQRSAMPA
jgi:hypothetical protein